jgi:hypothetical protein
MRAWTLAAEAARTFQYAGVMGITRPAVAGEHNPCGEEEAMLTTLHAVVQRITPDYVLAPMVTIALAAVVFLIIRHSRM